MKICILLLYCLVAVIHQSEAVSNGFSIAASNTNYDYQVAVLCPVIMCSGCMITTKAILTTGSCVNKLVPEDIFVVLGSNKYYSGGAFKTIKSINIHTSFTTSTYDYNVAVLGLSTTLTSGELSTFGITTLPLATALPPNNVWAVTSAYGATNPQLDLPNSLQGIWLLVYGTTSCQTYKKNRLTANMWCAGDSNGLGDLCPQDQGAPIVYQGQVVGIYSWGASCGLTSPNPSSPVFSNVPYFRSWILAAEKAA